MGSRSIPDHVGKAANLRHRQEEAAAWLAAIVESSDDAIISKDLDGVIMTWNRGAQRIFGYSAEEVVGRPVTMLFPEERLEEEPRILAQIRAGQRIDHFETVRRAKDGRLIDISLTVSPVKAADGTIVGASKIARDITVQKRAQAEIAAESDALARLNAATARLWECRDLNDGLQEILQAAMAMLGASKGNIQLVDRTKGVLQIAVQQGFAAPFLETFAEVSVEDPSACGRALRDRVEVQIHDVETDPDYEPLRAVARDAGYRGVYSVPLVSRGGEVVGILSTHFAEPHTPGDRQMRRLALYARQASALIERLRLERERELVEAQRELLVAELSHRVKNTLATVMSISQQSFSRTPDVQEGRRSFESRILGLAQTHARLAEANWSGVPLDILLADELAPYRNSLGSNISASGAAITLRAKAALMLGMAAHELATNAAKYGALSVPAGRVQIGWWRNEQARRLEILWQELDGPLVLPPKRRGFGRLLLERGIVYDLNGEVELLFVKSGLTCRIDLPLECIEGD